MFRISSIFLFIYLSHHQMMQTYSKAVTIRQMSAPVSTGNTLEATQSDPVNMFGTGTGSLGKNGSGGINSTSGTDPTGFMHYLTTINQHLATMFTNPGSTGMEMNTGSGNFEPVNMFGTGTGSLGNNGSGSVNSTSGTNPTAFMQYLASINQQLANMFTNPGSMGMGMNYGSGNFAGFGSENSFGPNTFSSSDFGSSSWSSKFGPSSSGNTTGSSQSTGASVGWVGLSSLSDSSNWNGHIKANSSSSTSLTSTNPSRRISDTGETSYGGAFGSSSTVIRRSVDGFLWRTRSKMQSSLGGSSGQRLNPLTVGGSVNAGSLYGSRGSASGTVLSGHGIRFMEVIFKVRKTNRPPNMFYTP